MVKIENQTEKTKKKTLHTAVQKVIIEAFLPNKSTIFVVCFVLTSSVAVHLNRLINELATFSLTLFYGMTTTKSIEMNKVVN